MKRTSKTSKVCHDINNDIQSTSEHKLLAKGMKSSKNLSLGEYIFIQNGCLPLPAKEKKSRFFSE